MFLYPEDGELPYAQVVFLLNSGKILVSLILPKPKVA